MKYFFTLFISSFLLLACQSKVKKNSFHDENNLFSVDFKQEPIKAIDTVETEVGKIILHTFIIEESPSIAKTVTYSDYPKEVIKHLKDPYDILNSAKQGAISSLGINQIIKDLKINENGVPGFELIGSNELGFHIHYKLLLKDNRLFQIGVLEESEKVERIKNEDFIESFVFLD